MSRITVSLRPGNPDAVAPDPTVLRPDGVAALYARPRTPNDNPEIEAFFSTLKGRLNYPGRFESFDEAQAWCADFFRWYNEEHHHSSLGFVTPSQRHAGMHRSLLTERGALKARCLAERRAYNQNTAAIRAEGRHQLRNTAVFGALGISLKTTNCLESINALVGQRTAKVDRRTNSSQKQRWLAAVLLDIEPRLRRIRGHRHLPLLRSALQAETRGEKIAVRHQAA